MTDSPDSPPDVQRALMERARRSAALDNEPTARPWLPRIAGLLLALAAMLTVLFAFDRFLASMQRFLNLPIVDPTPIAAGPDSTQAAPVPPAEAAEAAEAAEPGPDGSETMPVFVVPGG